ncbi:cyanophycinase [Micromonospora siamensis]|uniref:Cyanophycinase n=1 Tax=Micromonospora siamensis TaxID=299152 RepID=A0A1C5INU9_9ACTN|nr:cyanophycinase [Micromonospora siamensis]SCG59972.1 cyanophycinase [Micromonospora siamensis]
MTRPRILPLLSALIVTVAAGIAPTGAASAALAGIAPAAPATGPGAVLLVGGALADDNAAVYGEFVREAGGANARIGILSASSAVPHSSANAVAKVLKRYGAAETTWIPVTTKKDGSGDDPALAAQATSMTGFFFTGGDQFRYVQSMIRPDGSDGAVLAAIRQRFAVGAPVAGTSAGMQILAGRDMITGGSSYYGVRDGAKPGYYDTDATLGYWPAGGFGFVTSGLVDTHFDARGRGGRSLRLAADTGHDRVYGVGEDTALIVTGAGTARETARVVGSNGVSILDLRSAQVGQVGGHWSIGGVRWSHLTDGDAYDSVRWQVTKAPTSTPVVPQDRVAGPPTGDVFGSYAMRDAALDLAGAGRSTSTTGTTAETDPRFVVGLTEGDAFRAYAAGGAAPTSFTDLTLSVQAG